MSYPIGLSKIKLTQMTQGLLNKGFKVHSCFRLAISALALEFGGNKTALWHLRLGRKTKILVAIAIVAILLISFFAFLPQLSQWLGVSKPQSSLQSSGLIYAGQPVNTSVWLGIAAHAWAYFQPGIGVDPNTGLPYASGTNFKAFTAWDLGVYIQAVIDAQELGLIGTGGAWGSSARIEKVINFLETRPVNATTGYPFWFYDATNGQDYHPFSDLATSPVDGADTGRLLVALNNLKNFNSSLAPSIDNFVYNQSNYASIVPSVENDAGSNSVYAYYIDSGYASFWPQQVGNVPDAVLNNIANSQNITTYGVSLPDVAITCEPLLCSIFEVNSTDARLTNLMNQVYLAHQAYFNATGQYVAYSEGNTFSSDYIWEWVVAPDGQPWEITTAGNALYTGTPILYTKVALGFLALYSTTFSQNLVIHLQNILPYPTNGYSDGASNNGRSLSGIGSSTNGLILDAALYAIRSGS